MRLWVRVLAALAVGVGLVVLPGPAAFAAPQNVCTVADDRIPEISGLVALSNGYAVITDSNDADAVVRVYILNSRCKVDESRTLTAPNDPFDPEDLARTANGTFWVGDIGDSDTNPSRRTIAVHVIPPNGQATIQRMRYPDGFHNAEALLIQNNNIPVIVTKVATGPARVYKASRPITGPSKSAENAVPLTLVGQVDLGPGQIVTGAAAGPNGTTVALRTITDAFEWDVPDGDIASAIVKSKPRKTLLTGQTQSLNGEAISYSPDGRTFLTIAEGNPTTLQRFTPNRPAVPNPSKSAADSAAPGDGGDGSFLSKISFNQLSILVGAVGLIGLALLIAGIIGILRFRKRAGAPTGPKGLGGPDGPGGPGGPGARARGPGAGPNAAEGPPAPAEDTMQLPRVAGAVYGARPGAPGPPAGAPGYSNGRPPVRAGRTPSGDIPVRAPDAAFRAEAPPASGPPAGRRPVPRGGTVYGGGPDGADDPETTGSGRLRPPRPGTASVPTPGAAVPPPPPPRTRRSGGTPPPATRDPSVTRPARRPPPPAPEPLDPRAAPPRRTYGRPPPGPPVNRENRRPDPE